MSDTVKQPLPADPPDNSGGTGAALSAESDTTTTLPADPPDNGGGTES
jgi:hypothetical protein